MAKGILNIGGGVVSVDASGNFTVETGLIADGSSVFNETGVDVDFRIESDDNANMLFVDGGNDRVGIGTSAPVDELDMIGTLRIQAPDNGTDSALKIRQSNSITNGWDFMLDSDVAGWLYLDSVASDSHTNLITFDKTNNRVGIGTTAPTASLEIEGTAAGAEFKALVVENADSTTSTDESVAIHLQHQTLGGAKIVCGKEGTYGGSSVRLANLQFHTHRSGNAYGETMRLDSTGKVGIGTTAPASLLDVRGTVQVGVDNTGHDVIFYGATANRYMHWDESEDAVHFPDNTEIKIGTLAAGDMVLYHDGSNSFITNAVGTLKIATETSGILTVIGHTTSETTIGDNLTVTGTLTATLATAAQGSVTSLGTLTTLTVDNVIINGTTIGHTSNTDLLTLASGALTLDGSFQVGVDDAGFDVVFYGHLASSNMTWDASADDLFLNDARLVIDQDDDAGGIYIDSEATSAPAIESFGRYGISAISDVSGGYAGYFYRNIAEAGSWPVVQIIDEHTSNTQTTLYVRQDGTGDIVNFFDGGTEVFTILNGGNVGIGTTAPDVHLAIEGSGSTAYATTISAGRNSGSDLMWLKNSNASAGYVGLYFSVDSTQNPEARIAFTNEAGFDGDLTFAIRNPSDTGNVVERMRITSAGKVGIGTTAPAASLDVVGEIVMRRNAIRNPRFQAWAMGG